MKSLINETKDSPLALLIAVTSISPRTLRLNLLQKTAILVESARHNDSVSLLPPFLSLCLFFPSLRRGPPVLSPLSFDSLHPLSLLTLSLSPPPMPAAEFSPSSSPLPRPPFHVHALFQLSDVPPPPLS